MEDIIIGNLTGTISGTLITHFPTTFIETGTTGTTLTSGTIQTGGELIGLIIPLFIITYLILLKLQLKVEEEV